MSISVFYILKCFYAVPLVSDLYMFNPLYYMPKRISKQNLNSCFHVLTSVGLWFHQIVKHFNTLISMLYIQSVAILALLYFVHSYSIFKVQSPLLYTEVDV